MCVLYHNKKIGGKNDCIQGRPGCGESRMLLRRQGTWAGGACGSPLLDVPNRDVLTWPSCPKIHSSTSQVPTDSKTHYPSGKLHSSESEQATSLHSNTMSFTDKRLHTVWVRLYKVQTLAKVRGVVAFGGVVAGRRPKGSQGQVVLCVWIWVQVIKTCSICANSPKHTLRICVFFWSVVANLQTQTMVWGGGLAESLWFFLMNAGIIQWRQPTDCEDARGCKTRPCPQA